MIKKVIQSSMIDYPTKICTVIFIDSCNYNCKYCYNTSLKNLKSLDLEKDILPILIERKDFVNSVILSGGECTSDKDFDKYIDILYENEFNIGIHTNGQNYEKIVNSIDKISFVAVDYKTTIEKYGMFSAYKENNLHKLIDYLVKNNINYEIRTTLFPQYVNLEDCITIATELKKLNVNKYFLQQFIQVEDINCNIEPYDISYIKKIEVKCNEIIDTKLKI